MGTNSNSVDPQLAEKIVHEVKSQGVFDEFRKEAMKDFDTKPAYQNLHQRVENAVKKFLATQEWKPEMNKNQLRERLKRHITESGFLDVGVERIVDQVVNPKIGSVFKPRIEEIAFRYLGLPPPKIKHDHLPPTLIHPLPPLPLKVDTSSSLLPNDLEQVSPDSDRATVKSDCREKSPCMDIDEKLDDDEESPPFEPLIQCPKNAAVAEECIYYKINGSGEKNAILSNVADYNVSQSGAGTQNINAEVQDMSVSISVNTVEVYSEKEASRSLDTASQESQLSRISSDSELSTGSLNDTENDAQTKSQSLKDATVNISEEAQMPKFSENSNEDDGIRQNSSLHFDIKKDEIKFEGTERKANLFPANNSNFSEDQENAEISIITTGNATREKKRDMVDPKKAFQFSNVNEEAEGNTFSCSPENTNSAQLCIAEINKSEPTFCSEQKSLLAEPYSEITDSMVASKTSQQYKKYETDGSVRHTSSSSRHKKHSKERRRSHENDRYKTKDKNSSRYKYSNRRYSSSSSRRPHSTNNFPNDKNKLHRRSNSRKPSPSSSRSSSRSEVNHQKRERGKDNKTSSRYRSSSRDNSASSTFKKSDRKHAAPNDDHNESKDKLQRRKSSDSNDDDKTPGGGTVDPVHKPSTMSSARQKPKKSNEANIDTKSTQNETRGESDENDNQHRRKVVILNDILENPTTDFIELVKGTQANHIQVVKSTLKLPSTETIRDEEQGRDLLYFEETSCQFAERLEHIADAEGGLREVINSFDISETPYTTCKRKMGYDSQQVPSNANAEVLISCTQYSNEVCEQLNLETEAQKRMKISITKTSPTLSDTSVNSKENESYEKHSNSVISKESVISRRRNMAINKVSHQRYTSEDLYKPRPILGQRSKRRQVDTIV